MFAQPYKKGEDKSQPRVSHRNSDKLDVIGSKLRQSQLIHRHDLSLTEAYEISVEAQEDIEKLRYNLERTQLALQSARFTLSQKDLELQQAKLYITHTSIKIEKANTSAELLKINRSSLLLELQAAKEVLLSTLRKVQDLEIESEKVPRLEAKINKLEREVSTRYQDNTTGSMHMEDSEEGGSEEDLIVSVRKRQSGLGSRRTSGFIPSSLATSLAHTVTSSSGLHRRVSKVSYTSSEEESTSLLLRQMEALQRQHNQQEKDWEEERLELLGGLRKSNSDSGDTVSLSSSLPTSQCWDKVRELLSILRSLRTVNISEAVIGSLMLEAAEKADLGEVAVLQFLDILYNSTSDYKRRVTNNLLTSDVVALSDSSSSSLPVAEIDKVQTLEPRRPIGRPGQELGNIRQTDL